MPFSEIIEKSFKYPWKNRSLWFYGILIALLTGGVNTSNYIDPSSKEFSNFTKNIPSISNISSSTWVLVGTVFVVLIFGLIILSIIVTNWSEVAINRGVEQLEKGKKIERKKIGKTGKQVIWRMIMLNLIIPTLIVLALILTIILSIILFSIIPKPLGLYLGLIVGVMFAIILLIFICYISVIWPMASRFVSNDGLRAIESLKLSIKLIKSNYWISFGFNIVLAMISGMGTFVIFLPMLVMILAAFALFMAKIYIGVIILSILAFVYLIPLIIAEGYFLTFQKTGQTLWWLELKKLKK